MTDITNKIIICANGEDRFYDYDTFGVDFDSTEQDILQAISPMVRESLGVSLQEINGHWLFKTRKAMSNKNIYIIPNSTAGSESALSYLDDEARLRVFDTLTKGCKHVWSKNKLMDGRNEIKVKGKGGQVETIKENRLAPVWNTFADLAEKDPLFLAHFTSYAVRKIQDKDLLVLATLASTLSDADGTQFSVGSEYRKPNWRIVGQAAVQSLDPKLVLRVLQLAHKKEKFGSKAEAQHFSKHLRTAVRKYLRYREANPKALDGVVKSGLSNVYKRLYRLARVAPSPEACRILRWEQKPGFPGANVELEKSRFDFANLSDVEVAEKIRAERLSPMAVLGALPGKISPVVAASILEQSSGDQAVILTEMFEEQGLLKNAEVKTIYAAKIKTAKNALDRVERIQSDMAAETKAILAAAKSEKRKDDVGDFGKVFVHIDKSGSMQNAIQLAVDCGSTLAECVKSPESNFHWGVFNETGQVLPTPKSFEKAAFQAALYGQRAGGGTDCLALYACARQLGCHTDIYITDQGHTGRDLSAMIDGFRRIGLSDPRLVVIVDVREAAYIRAQGTPLKNAFEAKGIPVVMLEPAKLKESALVSQAVKAAFRGQKAILDEVLAEPLLSLPKWWWSVAA